MKVYTTVVTPIGNISPGTCDLTTVDALPELSVAVGSNQVTESDVVPGINVRLIGPGQFVMSGGVMSSSCTMKNIDCKS